MSGVSKLAATFKVALPVVILGVGALVATEMMNDPPRAKREPKPRTARLVEVQTVALTPQRARIHAMGTVRASRRLELRPQVGGRIQRLGDAFIPGGRFAAGELVARIDPADYDLTIKERQSQVVRARAELRLEQGRQKVAAQEYAMLGQGGDAELALRAPQLSSTRADLQAAEAALERAQLDRKRTAVTAPFNAIVDTRMVAVGAQVTPASVLGSLVGTDAYWVEVSVPASELRWIQVPRGDDEPGASARICHDRVWGEGNCRQGRVIGQASGLEEQGRMARLLVAVEDPLSLTQEHAGQPRLILGSYVRVELEGATDMTVAVLDRAHLRDGNQVWIADAEDKLQVRPVQVAFSDPQHVYVTSGLSDGDRLITTSLSGAVPGMPVRTGPERRRPKGPQPQAAQDGGSIRPGAQRDARN